MYKKVELKNGFVGMEHEVAKKWKEKDIIKKNFAMNEGKRYFTFMMDHQQPMENHMLDTSRQEL